VLLFYAKSTLRITPALILYVSVVIITCLALTSALIVLQSGSLNDVPVANTASLHSEATAVQKGDLEKGKDTFLVEWDGPTDPDVSCRVMLIQTVTPAYAPL